MRSPLLALSLLITGLPAQEIIIDNDGGPPAYAESGAWSTSGSTGYDGGTYRFANAGGAAAATWTANLAETDEYDVAVWYRDGSNRATSTRYEIQTASGLEVVTVDQTGNGLDWESLGTFDFDAGGATVTLDAAGSSGGSVVISDAVRFYQGGPPPPPPPTVLRTVTIRPGIVYTEYLMPGPVHVHVLEFDVASPELTLDMGFALGRRNYGSGRERTSQIAQRYDQPGHEVIAAINAAFYGSGLQVRGGTWAAGGNLVTLPDFTSAHDVWMFQDNEETWVARRPFFAATVSAVVNFENGVVIDIGRLNYTCDGTYSIYTPDWAATTGLTAQGVDVVVESVNYPLRPEKRMIGTITAVRTGSASVNGVIPAGGFVLRACSAADTALLANAVVGEQIELEIEIGPDILNNVAVLQHARGVLVDDGVASPESWIYADSFQRHPRTVLAANGSQHFFVVFDGRSAESIGVNVQHMADFLVDTLGVERAANFDGGGSSTLWIDDSIYNVPSDAAGERAVVNAVLLVREDATADLPISDEFPAEGRGPWWVDKFSQNPVVLFSPSAPGGDGSVMEVMNPRGGFETVSLGGIDDQHYAVEAQIRCDHRPEMAADGFERVGVFARDDGNANFDSTSNSGGNCYALAFDSDDGEIHALCVVEGLATDLVPPVVMPSDAWRPFRIECVGDRIRFLVDGTVIANVTDAAHRRGRAGVAYHERFADNGNALGGHVENFSLLPLSDPTSNLSAISSH